MALPDIRLGVQLTSRLLQVELRGDESAIGPTAVTPPTYPHAASV